MKTHVRKLIIAIIVITCLIWGGHAIDQYREASRSVLSGYFENLPATLSSKAGGRLQRICVHEGDVVQAGQLIAVLESLQTRPENEQAEAKAREAQAALDLAESSARPEEISRQRQAVSEAQAALDKLIDGARPEEIAQARAKALEAKSLYEKAKKGYRPEEIAQATASALAAGARLRALVRGLTPSEIAQYKARLDGATARAVQAQADFDRYEKLYKVEAITRQQYDQARQIRDSAVAAQNEAQSAYDKAREGTPAEELDAAKEEQKAAVAALLEAKNGSRPEDIEAAKAEMTAADQALDLITAPPREEDVRMAKAKLAQAKAILSELIAGPRPQERAQAKASFDAAKASVRQNLANLSERNVYAPKAGIIDRVLASDGDVLSPGSPVARFCDPGDIWIRVYVPESMLAKVKVNDSAKLKIDGVDTLIDAHVESIATQGEFTPANLQTPDERGKQVFEVRLRLNRSDPRVKAGIFATVRTLGGISL